MILASLTGTPATLLTHLADAALRSLVLGCAAGVVLNVARVKSISVRLNVWRAVLCVALIMPFLGFSLPAVTFRLPAQIAQTIDEFHFASRAGTEVEPHAANESPRSVELAQNSRELHLSDSLANPVAEGPKLTGGAIAASSTGSRLYFSRRKEAFSVSRATGYMKSQFAAMPWAAIAAATYLLVMLGFLIRFATGLILTVRLEGAAISVEDGRVLGLVSSRAGALGLNRLPRVAESELLSVPVTFGVLRPAILLPSGWRDWDEAEMDAVISHEISHVARRDALIDRLSLVHRAIFWFSPLSWFLTGCLAELAEEASDEAALAAGADRTRYAETLLGFFVELEAAPGRAWWHGVAMAKAGQAEKRLDRILEWKGSVAMQLKKSVVVLLVMCAVPVVYVAAALRPGAYNFSSSEYVSTQEQATAPPAPSAAPTPGTAPTPAPAPMAAPSPAPVVTVDPVTRVVVATTVAPKVSVAATAIVADAPVAKVDVKTAVAPKVSVSARTIVPVAIADPVKVRALAPLPMVTQNSHSGSTVVVMSDERDGDRHQFVISSGNTYISVSGNSESYGTDHPSEFVEFLQEKNPGDFIWFRRDGKSYIIRDAATIKRAKDFFAAVQDLDKKQEELGKQQEALGEKQEALGKQQEEVRVKLPDLTEDLKKLEGELKALGASGSQEDIGRIQGEIGDLQSKLGDIQSVAGEEQGKLGEAQGKLGEEQGKLGELQGELGQQQEKIFREASRQMKSLIDDAVAHGLAKPE
ncbi:MAG TPA: M56 family metallopeptidase [Candidatus Acidoferrales bacterium]|nr:M56 family metallopeptidase [Candidatus Acidoferrales bacterium]